MCAHRAEHIAKTLGNGEHLIVPPDPRRDRYDAADAGVARPGDYRIEFIGEVREVQMAMAVDQHRQPRLRGVRLDIAREHRTRCRKLARRGDPVRAAEPVE